MSGEACAHYYVERAVAEGSRGWRCNACGCRFGALPSDLGSQLADREALQTVVGEVEQAMRGEQRPEDCTTPVGRWAAQAADVLESEACADSRLATAAYRTSVEHFEAKR